MAHALTSPTGLRSRDLVRDATSVRGARFRLLAVAALPAIVGLLNPAAATAAPASGTGQAEPAALGVGGPLTPATGADPTFKALFNSWKRLDTLQDAVFAVPSEKPVRNAAFTSSYGVRSDPFQGRAAMHAGIDLAGPVGTPIYATADGTVTTAAWNNGGYGNLIKLDHGKGIETRYGHLSALLVSPGQRVRRGDLIAKMGSTGRSTGSHLHYEVRIDGRAVNPIPFMKSTDYILALRTPSGGGSMDQVALGGPVVNRAK